MAVTAEQFVQGLRQRGIRLDLVAEEPEPRFRLTGPKEQITERIREYIRRNREAIFALFGQCRCSDCWELLDEHDESTFHITDDGDVYCVRCWSAIIAVVEDAEPGQSKDAFQSCVGELATIFPDGCDMRYVQGLTAEEYIAQFYAERSAVPGKTVEQQETEAIEQEARTIVAGEGLPLAQALHWARVKASLAQRGYYDHLAEQRVIQRARVEAYRQRWLVHG